MLSVYGPLFTADGIRHGRGGSLDAISVECVGLHGGAEFRVDSGVAHGSSPGYGLWQGCIAKGNIAGVGPQWLVEGGQRQAPGGQSTCASESERRARRAELPGP